MNIRFDANGKPIEWEWFGSRCYRVKDIVMFEITQHKPAGVTFELRNGNRYLEKLEERQIQVLRDISGYSMTTLTEG